MYISQLFPRYLLHLKLDVPDYEQQYVARRDEERRGETREELREELDRSEKQDAGRRSNTPAPPRASDAQRRRREPLFLCVLVLYYNPSRVEHCPIGTPS